WVFGLLWAGLSGGGAWAATRGRPVRSTPLWQRLLVMIAPVVFLLGLLAGVSALGQDAIIAVFSPSLPSDTFLERATHSPWWNVGLVVVSACLVVIFGWLLSVNRFSMHALYCNRLVRCYLGASRPKPGIGSLGTATGVRVSDTQPRRQP